MVLCFSTDVAPSSFGMKIPSAFLHVSLIPFFSHIPLKYEYSRLATPGHLLYTKYGTPFGPGADLDRVRLSRLVNSVQVGGWLLYSTFGSSYWCRLSGILLSSSLLWSLCVFLRCSSTSALLLCSLPLGFGEIVSLENSKGWVRKLLQFLANVWKDRSNAQDTSRVIVVFLRGLR